MKRPQAPSPKTRSLAAPLAMLLVAAPLAISAVALGQQAESPEARFLEGLRQRRLFTLAEAHCRKRLEEPNRTGVERAELSIELARTLARHALDSRPQDREPLWRAAHAAAEDFIRQDAGHPRVLLVRVQDALTYLTRGELARQEAEAGLAAAPAAEEARRQIRAAIALLEELDGKLAKEIPLRRRAAAIAPGEWTADELLSVQLNIRGQLARGYRNQALSYPAGSDDRVAALMQALASLEPLVGLPESDPLAWPSRLDEIVSLRLLGNAEAARQRLARLEAAEPPAAIRLAARAERARLALAAGNHPEALAALGEGRILENTTSSELDFAHLETFVALWLAAARNNEPQEAEKWQKQAAAAARLIEDEHGLYWARRAHAYLARGAAGGGAGDLDVLELVARNHYLRKEYDDAVAAYDRLGRKALELGRQDAAFAHFSVAAEIERQRQRYREALARFRTLAVALPHDDKAPEAHWGAIVCASILAQQTQPPQLDEYLTLLDEHLARWPSGSAADRARWWYGQLRERQGNWAEAIRAYRGISPEFENHRQAVEGMARAYLAWLAELKTAGAPLEEAADNAARAFEAMLPLPGGRTPPPWSATARSAALAAAELRIRYTPRGYAAAEAILAEALRGGEAADDWKASAQAMLVVSLAGQGRRKEAESVLANLSEGPPWRLLDMLTGLAGLADAAGTGEARGELARLQLAGVELLRPRRRELEAGEQNVLEEIRAKALAAAGRRAEALAVYQRLAADNATDGRIQERYAQVLAEADDPSSQNMALAQWRIVLDRSEPRSPQWYRAKYGVALAHYKLGNKEEARQIVALLAARPPGLDATELKPQFLALLELCQK